MGAFHGIKQVVLAKVKTGEGDAVVESFVAGRSLLVTFGEGQVETVRQRLDGVAQAADLAVGSEFQEGSPDGGFGRDGNGDQPLRGSGQTIPSGAGVGPKVRFREAGRRIDAL